jgi:hypothetical protein
MSWIEKRRKIIMPDSLAKPDFLSQTLQPIQTLSALLRGLVERDYLDHMQDISWAVTTPGWRDPLTSIRLARLSEVSEMAWKLPVTPLLTGLASNEIGMSMTIVGSPADTQFYLGVHLNPEASIHPDEAFSLMNISLSVHLPGAKLEDALDADGFQETLLRAFDGFEHIACLTGVPPGASNQPVGIEALVDGLRGEHYLLLILAEPIIALELDDIVKNCRTLNTEIHKRVRQTSNQGQQHSTGSSTQSSQSFAGLNMLASGLLTGFSPLHLLAGSSASPSLSQSDSWNESEAFTESTSVEWLDKEMAHVEAYLDEFIDRLEQGRRNGLWNTGVYLLTRKRTTLNLGLSLLRSSVGVGSTKAEPLRGVVLTDHLDEARSSLAQFQLPVVSWSDGTHHPLGRKMDQFSTLLNSNELSSLFSLPKRQVMGMRILPMTQFNLNPPEIVGGLDLGQVMQFGRPISKKVSLPINDLARHAFVTGVTGAGKTNTCLVLLKSAAENNIPFLVIEPAKREYRQLVEKAGLDCKVYTLGDEMATPLRLNPFEFIPGFPILTHIDYLKAIFNASFPMYASMPYILEEAILGVYEDWGWDVTTGKNKWFDGEKAMQMLPTLSDLYNRIDIVVEEKRYAERLTMDITAALKARIKSLMVGGKGKMLDTRQSDSLQDIFTKPTILELRRIGNDDEKCFLIALLLVWLYEHCETRPEQAGLTHLTLIEEAHRILQNIPPASSDAIGARNQAVNAFSNMLAEIRAYGEGLVIVDQIPAKLAPDVIKNTDLKILHRLVAADDRNSVGQSMTLSDEQIEQVARLRVGEAVVFYEAAQTPILTKINEVNWPLSVPSLEIHPVMATRMESTCIYCLVPCVYGQEIEPSEELRDITIHGFIGLLIESKKKWRENWKAIIKQAFLDETTKKTPKNEIPERAYCAISKAIHVSLKQLLEYHQPSAQTQLNVIYSIESMKVIRELITKGPKAEILNDLEQLSRQLSSQLALEPNDVNPGCKLCSQKCVFGYWVTHVDKEQINLLGKGLIAALKDVENSPPTSMKKIVKIKDTTSNVVLGLFDGELESSDGFVHCVLTQMKLPQQRLEKLGYFK